MTLLLSPKPSYLSFHMKDDFFFPLLSFCLNGLLVFLSSSLSCFLFYLFSFFHCCMVVIYLFLQVKIGIQCGPPKVNSRLGLFGLISSVSERHDEFKSDKISMLLDCVSCTKSIKKEKIEE